VKNPTNNLLMMTAFKGHLRLSI